MRKLKRFLEEVAAILFVGICLGAGVALGYTAMMMWIVR